jgi:hypothetical protein
MKANIYKVSHELRSLLLERVPYVKIYWSNPKHLCPRLNSYGDNGQRSLKLWQPLLTYWLPQTNWNWQECVVSVMLISVRNIKVTCEWHKAIKLNTKTIALTFPSTLRRLKLMLSCESELPCADCSAQWCLVIRHAQWMSMASRTAYSTSTPQKPTLFDGHYLRNRSTLDIGVLGYIGIF